MTDRLELDLPEDRVPPPPSRLAKEAWTEARRALPGWAYAVLSRSMDGGAAPLADLDEIEKRLKKPFSSPGGKDVWAKWIISNIPAHEVYTEVYAGSASVFWAKEPSPVEVLSDKDPDIVNLFQLLKSGTDGDFAWIRKQDWSWSERTFERMKGSKPEGTRQRAYRFKYLNLHSVRGAGTHIDRTKNSSEPGRVFLSNLEWFRDRLMKTRVLNEDGLKVFKRFDGARTFHYVDPPWKPVGAGEVWRNFDEDAFIAAMKGARGKTLISYQGDLALGAGWTRLDKTMAQGGFAGDSRQQIYANYRGLKKRADGVSREFLEEVWEQAKTRLPGWAYATIRQQAVPRAGGRARHRVDEPTVLERLALTVLQPSSLQSLTDDELRQVSTRLEQWAKGFARRRLPAKSVVGAAGCVADEMTRRGFPPKEGAPPRAAGEVRPTGTVEAPLAKHIPTTGPVGAEVAFIGASPGEADSAAGEPFAGPVGETLRELYLEPLGVQRADVVLAHAVPDLLTDDHGNMREPTPDEIEARKAWLEGELDRLRPTVVVALGKSARAALGDRADFALPHPAAVQKFGDSGEVARKVRQIKERLSRRLDGENSGDRFMLSLAPADQRGRLIEKPSDEGRTEQAMNSLSVTIAKADPVKRVVYGVVLDPYGERGPEPDAHNDWMAPAEIEQTAHTFMKGPRVIGLQHQAATDAKVVESWVEQYPSRTDYLNAVDNRPHRVFRRKFGDDALHSGAWVLGVELTPELWAEYERGQINAFSPGGYGVRTPLTRGEMPEVKFVDLVEVAPLR